MQEFEQKILEQYDIEVNSTRKVRGAVLCETNKGVFLLKEVTTSEKRIPALCELYTWLYEQGEYQIDYMMANRNGEYISLLDNGDRYMLKKWYAGHECDIKKTREILEAAGNLAKLHTVMRHELEHGITEGIKTGEKYRRHNRELKKVRQFVRKAVPKGEFEFAFLQQFELMYQWAEAAVCELEQSDYEQLYQEEMNRSGMTHGEYNYHNIIMTREGIPSGYPGRGSVLFSQKSNGEKRVEAPARRWHAECVFCNPPTYQKRNRIFENPSDLSGKVLENCKFILLHE